MGLLRVVVRRNQLLPLGERERGRLVVGTGHTLTEAVDPRLGADGAFACVRAG